MTKQGSDTWGASMVAYPADTPESRARDAMKFVRAVLIDGHLTDISISMILVELKRCGVKLAHTPR